MSCGGTSMVCVRKLTLTMRSIMGIRKKIPGPRAPTNLPKRKTTPRSYSRSTLMELAIKNTNKTTSMMTGCIALILISLV